LEANILQPLTLLADPSYVVDRRTFIGLVGAAVSVGSPAYGQQPTSPVVIGYLSSRSPEEAASHLAAFRRGLREAGYVEGRDVTIEYRWAKGQYERLPALAKELAGRHVAVVVAVGGAPSALAAKAATATTPVVFLVGDDPVALGLVASFNPPARNMTGVSILTGSLGGKRLTLLCEMVSDVGPVAVLLNGTNPQAEEHRMDVQGAAQALGRQLLILRASSERQFDALFATLARERARALVVQNDPFFDSVRDRLVALAANRAIPAIYHIRESPDAGGLMSYGASLVEAYRQVGVSTGRILKGAKPGDLPVEQPTLFELVINLKTVRALGLTVPQSLLVRADEIIQ
jgi:putative ABC transport system substrate-binding protein